MYFLIDYIKKKNGAAHEREIRRRGQRVKIEQLSVNKPLIIKYIDDVDKFLFTSSVETYSGTEVDSECLIVQTHNSVYSLRRVFKE